MTTKIGVHWQRTHQSAQDAANFARWKPRAVKIITSSDDVNGIEDVPRDSLVVVRHHPMSENWEDRGFSSASHAENMGRQHAEKCADLAGWILVNRPGRGMDTTAFTGLNEPHVWHDEPPLWTAAYYVAFLDMLHLHGLHGVALNFGVGWPANRGTDTPPDWTPYESVRDAMLPGDYLGLHEYWDQRGPQNMWGWWAGRYTQCPWDVPIVIGECGIDAHVSAGGHHGWRGLISPQEYMDQLAWYDEQLQADPRIHSAMPFTYDFSMPWGTFDIRGDDFMRLLLDYAENLPDVPVPEPPEPPEPPPPPPPEWTEYDAKVGPFSFVLKLKERA